MVVVVVADEAAVAWIDLPCVGDNVEIGGGGGFFFFFLVNLSWEMENETKNIYPRTPPPTPLFRNKKRERERVKKKTKKKQLLTYNAYLQQKLHQ